MSKKQFNHSEFKTSVKELAEEYEVESANRAARGVAEGKTNIPEVDPKPVGSMTQREWEDQQRVWGYD